MPVREAICAVRMRLTAAVLVVLASTAGAQAPVYRNVPIPKADANATGIAFTLPIPDSMAAQRVREAAAKRKLELSREVEGTTYLTRTLLGLCDATRVPFVLPGTPSPTGPCVITLRVEYRPDTAGTAFTVSGNGMMKMPGADTFYGEWFHPRSSQWSMLRDLARAIAQP